jgi:putative RNA 2'-phosphotransferase
MMEKSLKNCPIDGFYRGYQCPKCDNIGKLLMYPDEVESLGRIIAGMLRHFPENYGVKLTSNGYAKIYSMIPTIKTQRGRYGWLTPLHIEALGKTDERGRYQVNETQEIRATYGHTIPVDLSDLPDSPVPDILYYQTSEEEFSILNETGINPSDKTYIHLSSNYRKAYVSGKFHLDEPMIIGVDASNLKTVTPVLKASDDVFLTSAVSPEYIKRVDQEIVELNREEMDEVNSFRNRLERKIMGERNY